MPILTKIQTKNLLIIIQLAQTNDSARHHLKNSIDKVRWTDKPASTIQKITTSLVINYNIRNNFKSQQEKNCFGAFFPPDETCNFFFTCRKTRFTDTHTPPFHGQVKRYLYNQNIKLFNYRWFNQVGSICFLKSFFEVFFIKFIDALRRLISRVNVARGPR